MRPGRWRDRIEAAKMRGFMKRIRKIGPEEYERRVKVRNRRRDHEEWVRSWRKRIENARARGRERARLYRGKRIYEVYFEDVDGRFRGAYLEGMNDEAEAIANTLHRYAVKDILKVQHMGYMNPSPKRSDTMPDGRPKLKIELD